jgi:hypothetical protein
MTLEQGFNLVEGVWWVGLGSWVLRFRTGSGGGGFAVLAVVLVVFGVSDFVEIFTGAWWRPVWLLAIKAACVAAGIITSVYLYRERRKP